MEETQHPVDKVKNVYRNVALSEETMKVLRDQAASEGRTLGGHVEKLIYEYETKR